MSTEDTAAAVPDEPVMDIGFLSLPAGVQQAAEALAAERLITRQKPSALCGILRSQVTAAITGSEDDDEWPAAAVDAVMAVVEPALEIARQRPVAPSPVAATDDTARDLSAGPERSREGAGLVTGRAVTLALAAVPAWERRTGAVVWPSPSEGLVRFMLEEAAPVIAAGERDRAERAEAALQNALEGFEEMLPYVPEFFREKWDLDAYVTRAKSALAIIGSEEESRPRVTVDLNARVRKHETYSGFEDVTGADPAALHWGDRIVAAESESRICADAIVTGVDAEKRLVYLVPDWHGWRDD